MKLLLRLQHVAEMVVVPVASLIFGWSRWNNSAYTCSILCILTMLGGNTYMLCVCLVGHV